MSEAHKHTIATIDLPEEETAPTEGRPMDWETAALLALSLLASLGYWFGHSPADGFYHGMGIGLTVTHWILTATMLFMAKHRGILKTTPDGVFLLLLSLLLSTAYGVFANRTMKLLNLPVLLLLTAQALFTLTGRNRHPPLSGQGLSEGLQRYAGSLFCCWEIPFRAAARLSRNRDGKRTGKTQLTAGICAAAAAAVLALALLSSADTVFSSFLNSILEQVRRVDGVFLLKVILSLLLCMLLFSHRCSMLKDPGEIHPVATGVKDPTVFRMVLCALAIVYGLFAYVQVRYLFAGAESVRMNGGYAAYARSGFFQLVLVALLTLCLILPALVFCRNDKPVRILCALVALLTALIDFSAFFRMRLYIEAFGLTTLRIVTLWGIGMILLALLAALAKDIRPDVRICPLLAAAALTTWVLLNWINVDSRVAENLVARYNAEQHEGLENVAALASDQYWSPDYYAAFEKISDPEARTEALTLLDTRASAEDDGMRLYREPKPYDWCLCYIKVPVN